jgi:hypothetical protein
MNLRIDLILQSEQRSTSLFTPKTLGRLAATILPIVLGALAAMAVFDSLRLKSELKGLEAAWDKVGPREERALHLKEQAAANTEIEQELEGWRKSRVAWHGPLLAMMQTVPSTIQVRSLGVEQRLQLIGEGVPARASELLITGKATGADAEANVQRLKARLQKALSELDELTSAEVTKYAADTSRGASKSDRVFEITCKYKAKTFE